MDPIINPDNKKIRIIQATFSVLNASSVSM